MITNIKTKPVPYCPECGAQMILRRPPRHKRDRWEPFWGCSQFPDCKGSRNVDPDTGEAESDE